MSNISQTRQDKKIYNKVIRNWEKITYSPLIRQRFKGSSSFNNLCINKIISQKEELEIVNLWKINKNKYRRGFEERNKRQNGQNSKEKAMQICALNSKQQFLQSSRSIDLAFFVLKAEEILSPPHPISLSPSQILGNTSLTTYFEFLWFMFRK